MLGFLKRVFIWVLTIGWFIVTGYVAYELLFVEGCDNFLTRCLNADSLDDAWGLIIHFTVLLVIAGSSVGKKNR